MIFGQFIEHVPVKSKTISFFLIFFYIFLNLTYKIYFFTEIHLKQQIKSLPLTLDGWPG